MEEWELVFGEDWMKEVCRKCGEVVYEEEYKEDEEEQKWKI